MGVKESDFEHWAAAAAATGSNTDAAAAAPPDLLPCKLCDDGRLYLRQDTLKHLEQEHDFFNTDAKEKEDMEDEVKKEGKATKDKVSKKEKVTKTSKAAKQDKVNKDDETPSERKETEKTAEDDTEAKDEDGEANRNADEEPDEDGSGGDAEESEPPRTDEGTGAPIQCGFCTEEFASQAIVDAHVSSVHLGNNDDSLVLDDDIAEEPNEDPLEDPLAFEGSMEDGEEEGGEAEAKEERADAEEEEAPAAEAVEDPAEDEAAAEDDPAEPPPRPWHSGCDFHCSGCDGLFFDKESARQHSISKHGAQKCTFRKVRTRYVPCLTCADGGGNKSNSGGDSILRWDLESISAHLRERHDGEAPAEYAARHAVATFDDVMDRLKRFKGPDKQREQPQPQVQPQTQTQSQSQPQPEPKDLQQEPQQTQQEPQHPQPEPQPQPKEEPADEEYYKPAEDSMTNAESIAQAIKAASGAARPARESTADRFHHGFSYMEDDDSEAVDDPDEVECPSPKRPRPELRHATRLKMRQCSVVLTRVEDAVRAARRHKAPGPAVKKAKKSKSKKKVKRSFATSYVCRRCPAFDTPILRDLVAHSKREHGKARPRDGADFAVVRY